MKKLTKAQKKEWLRLAAPLLALTKEQKEAMWKPAYSPTISEAIKNIYLDKSVPKGKVYIMQKPT